MTDKICYPAKRCTLCSRKGVVSIPRVIGDILDIDVMLVGQNPGYSPTGKPDTHIAFYGYNFTCDLIEKCINGFNNLYFTNIIRCASTNKITDDEVFECITNFFCRELTFIRPKCVLCVGSVARNAIESVAAVSNQKFVMESVVHPGFLARINASEKKISTYVNEFRQILAKYCV